MEPLQYKTIREGIAASLRYGALTACGSKTIADYACRLARGKLKQRKVEDGGWEMRVVEAGRRKRR
jgi:hypothetical protein